LLQAVLHQLFNLLVVVVVLEEQVLPIKPRLMVALVEVVQDQVQ
jgi:hypothetical protein